LGAVISERKNYLRPILDAIFNKLISFAEARRMEDWLPIIFETDLIQIIE
jgi:hypothetical protein